MRRSWRIMLLALVVLATVAGCAATAPPPPTAGGEPPGGTASLLPSHRPTDPPAASEPTVPSPSASSTDVLPSPAPTLRPGSRLAIRYSGTPGTEFRGLATGLFEDGAVVPVDASGVLGQRPHTQTLGGAIIALRVTGTILSGTGTYRVEILGGHLDPEGIFVMDQVLAMDEATDRGGEVQVDYGNIDV